MAVTTSTTEINAIDQTYPVAGQDNDSQGFRDNFNIIRTQLSNVAADLTSLDTNAALKNATNNDFNGNKISEANFIACTEERYGIGNVSSSNNVNWSNGHYQTVQVGADLTLTLTEWPANGKLGKLYLKKAQLHGGDSSNHPYMSGLVSRHDNDWIVVSTTSKHMLLIEQVLDNKGNNIINKIKPGDRFYTPQKEIINSKKKRTIFTSKGLKK